MQTMEEPSRGISQGRVSFKSQQLLPTYINGKFEQSCWTRSANRERNRKKKEYINYCYESLDMPMHTMEFLCRSWSPTASNFRRTFSPPNSQNLEVDDKQHGLERREEEKVDHDRDSGEEEGLATAQAIEYVNAHAAQFNYGNTASHNIWARFFVERCRPSVARSSISLDINKRVKGWLRGKSLTDVFMKRRRGEEKKEIRLLTAKIHAALSVAQLAAAIAGFAATNSMEMSKDIHNQDTKKCNVVAYAAEMLASACAEAAETAGATQAQVASAVNSGLATQSPADMITLTASAATSLRGAETLKSRAASGLHFPGNKDPVKLTANLSIITPSGKKGLRLVTIHLKYRKLMLCLEKKYLGILTSSREYTILQVRREEKAQGYYLLGIKCSDGHIKLLFEDGEQSLVWMSSISSFLQIYNSFNV